MKEKMVSGLYGSLQDKTFKTICPGRNSGRTFFSLFVPALSLLITCFMFSGSSTVIIHKYGATSCPHTAVTLLLLYGSAYAVRGGHGGRCRDSSGHGYWV